MIAARCPFCGCADFLSVRHYEPGGRWYVECDNPGCWYRGPGHGIRLMAIKGHNAHATAATKSEAA